MRRLSRLGTWIALGVIAIAAAWCTVSTTNASAAPAVISLNGTWQCCGAGGAATQLFVISGTHVTLEDPDGTPFGTATLTLSGDNVTMDQTYTGGGYTATFVGTVSPGGGEMSGTWTSNEGQSGTWTALLTSSTTNGTLRIRGVPKVVAAGAEVHLSSRNVCPIPPTQTDRTGVAAAVNVGRYYHGTYNFMQGFGAPADPRGKWSLTIALPRPDEHTDEVYGGSGALAGQPIVIAPGTYYISASCVLAGNTYADYQTVRFTLTVSAPPSVAVAPIARDLGTPQQIFGNVPHDVANAAITLGAIMFITFPSSIFNSTFSANYDEILLILANWRRRLRRLRHPFTKPADSTPPATETATAAAHAPTSAEDATAPPATADPATRPGEATRFWFAFALIGGAVLGGLLNPKFGLNSKTATGFVATLLAFGFGALISWFVAKRFRKWHHYGATAYRKALPLGLVVAALCVVVSRLTSFEPGYLYGVVVAVAFQETIEERHNAHLTALSTVTTLTVALVAWFAWLPVNHLATHHLTNVPLGVVDDVLASVFIGGLVGTVVGLLPLALMPGHTLLKWRLDAWVVIFFVATFLMISVELRPAAGPTHPGSAGWVTPLVLFALFGGLTFYMRWYFARRHRRQAAAATVPTSTH